MRVNEMWSSQPALGGHRKMELKSWIFLSSTSEETLDKLPDLSKPGKILQARILESVAISYSRGSS